MKKELLHNYFYKIREPSKNEHTSTIIKIGCPMIAGPEGVGDMLSAPASIQPHHTASNISPSPAIKDGMVLERHRQRVRIMA